MKKMLLGLTGLVLLIAVGVFGYLYLNLNSLIKQGIEEFAPRYTQTPVSLGGASVSILSGEGGLSDLVIGNPAGYKAKEAVRLGSINVSVDLGTVTSDTIVIKSLDIVAPAISYEPGGKAGSNLQMLVKNIEQSTRAASSSKGPDKVESGGEKKIIVDRLTLSNGRLAIFTPLASQAIEAELPTIEMKGIGRGKGGASAGSVLKLVMAEVTESASKVAGVSLRDLKKQTAEKAGKKLNEAVGDITGKASEKLKGLFGN